MPPAITDLPVQLDPPRKRWTRSEYEELGSSGLLNGERLELVEGELISKMGKKRPHVNSVALLQGLLVEVFGVRFVNAAAPIDAAPEDNPSNEPEPDVIVLKRDLSHYRNENPRPQDLQLVVEIADSTLGFDLTTKLPFTHVPASSSLGCWTFAGRRMIVHRDPAAGRRVSVAAYGAEESVSPLAAPDSHLRVRDAFPG